MHYLRCLFAFGFFACLLYIQTAKADVVSEYMFNVATMLGSATTCKEVINNPGAAKQSVVGVIDAINKLSPTNKIETSSVINTFDAILLYCTKNPSDLLLNALLKTSGVSAPQDVKTSETNLPMTSLDNNPLRQHNNNNSGSTKMHKQDSTASGNQGVEFIN